MAIVWGKTAGGDNPHKVGIDLSVEGTKVTADYYCNSQYNASDNQTLVRTLNLKGSASYTKSGAGNQKIYSGSLTGERGKSYSFKAEITGIYTGGVPEVEVSITIPAAVPSKPSAPSLGSVTDTTVVASLGSAPASNGASISRYEWQREGGGVASSGTTRSITLTGLTPNSSLRVRVRAVNSAGEGDWSDYSSSVTTKPLAPDTPGTPTVARVSDTSHTITLAPKASSTKPVASQQIQRRPWAGTVWGSWAQIGTASATATSYSDTTTVPNGVYQWRSVSVNAGGSTPSAESATARTTPVPPIDLVAEKSGADIAIAGTDQATEPTWRTFGWQDNPGGAGWVGVGSATAAPSFLATAVNASVTHQYRAAVSVPSGTTNATTLTSAWSSPSNVVQLQAPPAAPTIQTPTGTQDRDAALVLPFTHNPVDTTKQTAFEAQYRMGSGSWTTITGTTATQITIPASGVTGILTVQIRTRGAHASFGDWATVTISMAARPTVAIGSPASGAVLATSTVPLAWTYYAADGSGQVEWSVTVWDPTGQDPRRITRSGSGTTAAVSIPGATDANPWTVQVQVRSASGLRASAEVTVTVVFTPPQMATVEAVFDRSDGSVGVDFDLVPDAALLEPVSLDLERRVDDGPWETLISGLDPLGSWTDRDTPLAGRVAWRTITTTTDGATAAGPESVIWMCDGSWTPEATDDDQVIAIGDAYLTLGDVTCRAMLGLTDVEDDDGLDDMTVTRFAGDDYGMEFGGVGRSGELTGDCIAPDRPRASADGVPLSTVAEWDRLITTPGPKVWRDPTGRVVLVSTSRVSKKRAGTGHHALSWPMKRVRRPVLIN